MKSTFFYNKHYLKIADRVQQHVNQTTDFLSAHTSRSTRAAGDAIEGIIAEKFNLFLGDWCKEYSSNFARRAMADIAFKDKEGFYCVIDVKTHREDTKFNMPNLTSVERLARFYEDDMNIFALILAKYALDGNRVIVTDVQFCPIEFLGWDCLTIGALGWGQIQISNSNHVIINRGFSRKAWMLTLCDTMLEFYPKEILKINERMGRFQEIKAYWYEKVDSWI